MDSATNCSGLACDYVIGTNGFPDLLTAQVGGATFPLEVAATGLNFWESPGSAVNYPDTFGIASYEYQDPNWDNDEGLIGQSGQFLCSPFFLFVEQGIV